MNLFDEVMVDFDWQKAWKDIGGTNSVQQRYGDDHRFGTLQVQFSVNGDAWINIISDPEEFGHTQRFRECFCGGGESKRVREAIMLLALAIASDNKDRPQNR